MSTSTSLQAYNDCLDLFDRALETSRGIRAPTDNEAAAIHLRMRLHYARKLLREKNKEIYEPGDPLYGCHESDKLVIRVKFSNGKWWVYLETRPAIVSQAEDLENVIEEEPARPIPREQLERLLQPRSEPVKNYLPATKITRKI